MSTEHLSDQQIARLEALQAAFPLSRKTGGPLGPITPPDTPNLVDLAEYIMVGVHPYDRYPEKT